MRKKTDFVLCGLGNIGSQVISSILKNPEDNLNVVAVCARNKIKAQKKLNDFKLKIPIIEPNETSNYAKVLVETNLSAEEEARKAIKIASETCVFTNNNITIEKV